MPHFFMVWLESWIVGKFIDIAGISVYVYLFPIQSQNPVPILY